MNRARSHRPSHLRVVEVVNVDADDMGLAEAIRLFDIARRENEVIDALGGCVAQLNAARAAKVALSRFPAATLRAALDAGRERGVRA